MAKPAMVGTINGRFAAKARVGAKVFGFDGTTKGLALAAVAAGVPLGAVLNTCIGKMKLVLSPGDDRANGYWCQQVWA